MKNQLVLALCIHHTRLDEALDLLKAHLVECASLAIIYGGEDAQAIQSRAGIQLTLYASSPRQWEEQIPKLISSRQIRGLIYLGDNSVKLSSDMHLVQILEKGIEEDLPVAANITSAEGLIHLMSEYPEALSGHHLAAGYLEEIAYQQ
jgi:methylglyoxal synthase